MASNAQNPSLADPARRSGTASQASPEAARGLGGRLGRDTAALRHPTPRAFPGGGPALAIQNQRTRQIPARSATQTMLPPSPGAGLPLGAGSESSPPGRSSTQLFERWHPSWTAGCVRKSLPNSHGHRGWPCPRRRTWKSRGRPPGARLSINSIQIRLPLQVPAGDRPIN